MVKLLSVDEIENLSIEEIWKLYAEYVNPAQVEILSKFSWGRDRFERAEGMYLYTTDGRQIMDFTGGIGVLDHGHNHPRILAARKAYQDKKRMEIHKVIFSPYLAALCHNIAQLLPGDLNKSFFPNSGAEAVEGALKLAYKASFKSADDKRDYILFSDIAFHGKLIGTGTISGKPQKHFDFPRMENTDWFEYGNLESVKKKVAELRRADGSSNVYAIIIEPFHASTATPCSAEFLYGLRELCDNEGIGLIFDEVYSGWGKTGSLFYFMRHEGLLPDVVTMSQKEYGWETNKTYGANQWRMGDGQTAFTNYIGYTVAGFSEFDNFRAHQVREGLLTRDEALELVAIDNRPRYQTLEYFAHLVGLNLDDVLARINSIPKMYA